MKDIDAENFKTPVQDQSPTSEALNPNPVPVQPLEKLELDTSIQMVSEPKKTRTRKEKPTEESTIEYVPRSQKSVKVFRRINVSINGIPYTNNEIGYEIVADTREEALEEAKSLRENALADIRELNALMKVQPATQTAPTPVAPVKVEVPAQSVPVTPTAIVSAVNDVFPESNFDADKVKKAVAMKNPA